MDKTNTRIGVELSEKVEKIRVSVTMTKPYLEALDRLMEEGVYLSRGEAILEALRGLFRDYGIEPFEPKRRSQNGD